MVLCGFPPLFQRIYIGLRYLVVCVTNREGISTLSSGINAWLNFTRCILLFRSRNQGPRKIDSCTIRVLLRFSRTRARFTAVSQKFDPIKCLSTNRIRYLSGSRVLETHIYKRQSYPYDLVAPLTVIWRPQTQTSSPTDRKGKARQTNNFSSTQGTVLSTRSVWLRFHPSVHTVVFDTLKEATSYSLSEYRSLHGDSEGATIEIVNLQGLVNVFEIMGPKSSQVIKGALSPILSEQRHEFLQAGSIFR